MCDVFFMLLDVIIRVLIIAVDLVLVGCCDSRRPGWVSLSPCGHSAGGFGQDRPPSVTPPPFCRRARSGLACRRARSGLAPIRHPETVQTTQPSRPPGCRTPPRSV